MQEWQQRVIDERDQLAERLAALESFIEGDKFGAVARVDRLLLIQQERSMRAYLSTLRERVERFYA